MINHLTTRELYYHAPSLNHGGVFFYLIEIHGRLFLAGFERDQSDGEVLPALLLRDLQGKEFTDAQMIAVSDVNEAIRQAVLAGERWAEGHGVKPATPSGKVILPAQTPKPPDDDSNPIPF